MQFFCNLALLCTMYYVKCTIFVVFLTGPKGTLGEVGFKGELGDQGFPGEKGKHGADLPVLFIYFDRSCHQMSPAEEANV